MVTTVAATLVTITLPTVAQADPCAPLSNPVACENSKLGTDPAIWDVSGAGSSSIQGYTTDISANVGETVRFKVDTPAQAYRIDVYRLGFYAGRGARAVATVQPTAALPQSQPSCLTNAGTGLVDCGNWAVSALWTVPLDTVSGVFVAKLVRTDGTAGSSHIPFVVRNDSSRSDVLLQTADTTWQAYNQYGGNSLYVGAPAGRAYKVSYNRPITTRGTSPEDSVFNAEFPMIRFLEANGYDVSYTSGVDTDRRGALLLNHKTFVSVGHDEYWSGQQRRNVESARDAGVHLAFFSGNEVFWKTRWETSIDGSGTAHRTLVCYKETKAGAKIDPSPEWTGTWRDPRFSPPSDGGRPENALTGTLFLVNGGTSRRDSIRIPEADGKMRFWRGTAVAAQAAGATATMPAGTLGYEWDAELDNGARPAGLIRLSTATYDIAGDLLLDQGSTYGSGSATHALTLYRAPSGALVFGAGSVQWSWGLDATHDLAGTPTNASMRQATVNLLADMGVQPTTLAAGLTVASTSTDTATPTSTITSPSAGVTLTAGSPITISGTAADAGGRVGGVEVSVDGGMTWRRANGRASWTYAWTPSSSGAVTLRTRAADDSGNLETPSAGVTVGTGPLPPASCPCTVFGQAVPAVAADPDSSAVELGMRFRASRDGLVTGVRFFKGATNTGAHTGSLWSNAGVRLASVAFSGESASGWQSMSFASPVAVTAGTTYVVSYYAPVGRYAKNKGFFASAGVTSGPLTALRNGVDGANGVYRYGAGGGFPAATFASTNYWVDVVFADGSGGGTPDTTAPTVTGRSPAAGATGVGAGVVVSATFSEPVQPATVGLTLTGPGGAVPAVVAVDGAGTTATLTPGSALQAGAVHTAVLSGARDVAGNLMAPVSWSFTTAAAPLPPASCPCTVFGQAVPAVAADPDSSAVELGMRFRASRDGLVTGVRFFKGATNTGAHTGSLWSNAGVRLASVAFSGESASGWQSMSFASPVAVTAGTTYVVSYYAPVGRYAKNKGFFASAGVTSGPLTALRNGVDGANGVYRYGAGGGFPTSTWQSTNYWVDVTFS